MIFRLQTKLFAIILLLSLYSCSQKTERLFKKQYFIFGTIVDVLIWDDDENQVSTALEKVEAMLNSMHNQWHAWKPGRLLEINQSLRNGESIKLSDYESAFLQETQELSKQSLNYFNPAIGELINLWGFHTDNYPITTPPPTESQIEEYLRETPTMQDLIVNGNLFSSKNTSIWLDFGGVAKGHAIDRAIEILQTHNIKNAIVNAGGDLRSIGKKGQKDWKVAIRKPNSEDVVAVIEVKGDESIFTSGNYERYKEFNGKRYAHIINPKTGYGIENIISSTIIAKNGTLADAAATALIIAEDIDRKTIIKNLGLTQVLLIEENGQCLYTKEMQKRIDLECGIIE